VVDLDTDHLAPWTAITLTFHWSLDDSWQGSDSTVPVVPPEPAPDTDVP